jgi:hypothetical protein
VARPPGINGWCGGGTTDVARPDFNCYEEPAEWNPNRRWADEMGCPRFDQPFETGWMHYPLVEDCHDQPGGWPPNNTWNGPEGDEMAAPRIENCYEAPLFRQPRPTMPWQHRNAFRNLTLQVY